MGCSASTFPRALTCRGGAPRTSTRSPPRSTADLARPSVGGHPPKPSPSGYRPSNRSVLLPPVESGQYVALRYTERLAEAGAVASVGSRGDSYDNALAEAFNSLFKAELVRNRGPWTGIGDLEIAVAEYLDWFNHRRLHGELAHVPPVEYESQHRNTPLPERTAPREFSPSIKPGT